MREKAISTNKGATYQFIEAKFGSYPFDVVNKGVPPAPAHRSRGGRRKSSPARSTSSQPMQNRSSSAGTKPRCDPGWCKLDWVVADPVRGKLSAASNMLDVTWEAPDGTITPLDGYLDPYFQEVYLEAESVPIFSKLAKHVTAMRSTTMSTNWNTKSPNT